MSKQARFAPSRNLPKVSVEVLNRQYLSTLNWDNLLTSVQRETYGALLSYTQQHSSDGFIEKWHPSFLATKANAEDHPSWDEAMSGPHANGFWEACKLVLETLEKKDCWEVVDRPNGRSIVSST
jgi:hypothetical protein